MHIRRFIAVLIAAALAWPAAAAAQSFEGTMTQRTIELDEYALFDLYFAEAEEPDFESEEDWIRHTAEQLFNLPLERLLEADGADVEEITMWVKGSKIRYEGGGPGGDMYMIMDAASQTTWMVIPSQRAYVKFTAEDVEAAAADAATQAEEMMARMGVNPRDIEAFDEQYDEAYEEEGAFRGFEPAVRPLGQTREVNGISATAFEAVAGREVAMGWCADDTRGLIATLEALTRMSGLAGEEEDDASGPSPTDMVCEGKLPVRTSAFFADGQRYSIDEITSVERTAVPDGHFEIPAGYTERSLSDMWR